MGKGEFEFGIEDFLSGQAEGWETMILSQNIKPSRSIWCKSIIGFKVPER